MDLAQAQGIADGLIEALAPACEWIGVAGSIRRRKPNPKDVEIVYVPRLETRQVDLFGTTEQVPLTDQVVAWLVKAEILAWDEEIKRRGPRYKRLIHVETGAVVELFAARADNLGLILALRTGPGEFNRILVTARRYGGAMPAGMRMRDGFLWRGGRRLETPTEEEFFAALDLPCWPPEERTADRLLGWLRSQRRHRRGGETR